MPKPGTGKEKSIQCEMGWFLRGVREGYKEEMQAGTREVSGVGRPPSKEARRKKGGGLGVFTAARKATLDSGTGNDQSKPQMAGSCILESHGSSAEKETSHTTNPLKKAHLFQNGGCREAEGRKWGPVKIS